MSHRLKVFLEFLGMNITLFGAHSYMQFCSMPFWIPWFFKIKNALRLKDFIKVFDILYRSQSWPMWRSRAFNAYWHATSGIYDVLFHCYSICTTKHFKRDIIYIFFAQASNNVDKNNKCDGVTYSLWKSKELIIFFVLEFFFFYRNRTINQ